MPKTLNKPIKRFIQSLVIVAVKTRKPEILKPDFFILDEYVYRWKLETSFID